MNIIIIVAVNRNKLLDNFIHHTNTRHYTSALQPINVFFHASLVNTQNNCKTV